MSETTVGNSLREFNQKVSEKLDGLSKNIAELLAKCDPTKRPSLLARFTDKIGRAHV